MYLFYGRPDGLDTVHDLKLVGETANDGFGVSVAPAGDMNGDGYSDLIVGGYQAQGLAPLSGRAYVFLGARTGQISTVPSLVIDGEGGDDALGVSVSSAGDVNGDGYGDVIVGAMFAPGEGPSTGRAYIHLGASTASMDAAPDTVLAGFADHDFFGQSVAGAGDLDGDGYADVVVGAPRADVDAVANDDSGRVYVFRGGVGGMDNNPELILFGPAADATFGASVAGGGDTNGDGFADLVVGADGSASMPGQVWIYPGHPNTLVSPTADSTTASADLGDAYGSCVAAAGDVNSDGLGDLLVGANRSDVTDVDEGQAFLFFGQSNALQSAPAAVFVGTPGARLGLSMSGVGDVNGDGTGDILVGAPFDDAGGNSRGRAFFYVGEVGMFDETPDATLTGEADLDVFGYTKWP
ncbi:MAG: integrin alpha [Myxococcota bacterium]